MKLTLLCSIALLGSADLHAQAAGPALRRQLEAARAAATKGELDAAASGFREALAADPRNSDVLLEYAQVLQRAKRFSESADALSRAAAIGTRFDPQVRMAIARNHAFAGHADSALVAIERALAARYENRPGIWNDTAFVALRGNPRFRALAAAPDSTLSRVEAWRADLQFLVAEAQRMHPALERPAFASAFVGGAGRLAERAGSLSDDQIKLEIRGLLAMLGDGHSSANLSFSQLPVGTYWFSDGLVITGTSDSSFLKHVGARVTAIGGVPIAEAVQRVATYISRDNEMGVLVTAPTLLRFPVVLHAIGAARDTTHAVYEVRDSAGRTSTLEMAGSPARPFLLRASTPPRPLYLRETAPYSLTQLPEREAVYVLFNAVANRPDEPMDRFADRLKQVTATSGAKHLIVDIRNNGGGNSNLFPPLVDAIIAFREAAADHRVWVITSRRTFSAAQNFANTLDRFVRDVTFVGEPTGSRPNFIGESAPTVLPNSRMSMTISTRYHQNSDFTDRRAWIAPQVPVPFTSKDFFEGRDSALDAIFALTAATRP